MKRRIHGKKTNAKILTQICCDEGIPLNEVIYIGDSLSKDMLMAKQAGMISIWCDYPQNNFRELYDKLVAISHWTDEDFQCEAQYKKEWEANKYTPEYVIHDFSECKQIIAHINNQFHTNLP